MEGMITESCLDKAEGEEVPAVRQAVRTSISSRRRKKPEQKSNPETEQKTLTAIFPMQTVREQTPSKEEEKVVKLTLTPPEKNEKLLETMIDEIREFLMKEKERWGGGVDEQVEKKERNEDDEQDEIAQQPETVKPAPEEEDAAPKQKKPRKKKAGEWDHLNHTERLKANLQRGAKVLMSPLSIPLYLDRKNQGRFYNFNMDEKRAYIRSALHPIRKEIPILQEKTMVAKTTLKPEKLKGGGQAHVGLYPNIFVKLPPVPGREVTKSREINAGERFDKAIAYKKELAKYATDIALKMPFVSVQFKNDYHPLMVLVNVKRFLSTYFKTIGKVELAANEKLLDSCSEPFTKFLMHFFAGMVNKVARQCRMHVDVTIRNSFGYDTPSLADTPVESEEIGSFRINFGLILPAYVEIVCFTLNELAQMLDSLLTNTKAMKKEPHRIPGMRIEYYDLADQHKVKDQEAIRDILEYACFKIETGGKPTINSITRTSEACDLINKTAFDTYIPGNNTSLMKAFATSMLRLFMSMSVDKSLSTIVDAAHNVYMDYEPRDASLLAKDIYEIRPDLLLKLDEILKITIRQIEILFSQIDVASKKKLAIIKSWAEVIASNLHVRNPYLPVFLDISTEFMYYLILKQLENPSANPDLQDGDASDSEHEDDEIIGKKVVTHNGMRAILTPVETIKRIIRNKKRPLSQDIELDVSATYFEVKQALDIMPGLNYDGRPGKKDMLQKQPDAVLRDNNACVNTETNQLSKPVKDQMAESDVEFWIVDITGSTQKETDELIEMLKKRPEKLLFLVSSGFKHEQSGGEKNPYGTVRVFAHQRNRKAWEDAFDKLITCDKGLPGLSHHIRRMHKLIGNTPTNASIKSAAEAIPDQQEEALQLHENRTVMLEAAETHPAPKPPVDKAEAQDMEDI